MSARNGQRSRFHLNRKRRVVQRMKVRALLQSLKEQKAAGAAPAAGRKDGPARTGNSPE